jgi:predicted DNA-binding protein
MAEMEDYTFAVAYFGRAHCGDRKYAARKTTPNDFHQEHVSHLI